MQNKKIATRSGLAGWQGKLQDQYARYEEFVSWDDTYRLAAKLGYTCPSEAWDANPTIQGSVHPDDYCRVLSPDDLPVAVKVVIELQVDGDNLVAEWEVRHAIEQAVTNALELVGKNGFSHDWADSLSIGLVSVESNQGKLT